MKPQPKTKPKTISEVCMRAAEIIRERGWTQGTYEHTAGTEHLYTKTIGKGQVCTIGAIAMAYDPSFAGWPADAIAILHSHMVIRTEMAVHRQLNLGRDTVPVWNDRKERTAEDVIAALEATAIANAGKD